MPVRRGPARLALGFAHISNAQLGPRNPGNEVLRLPWPFPIVR